MPDDPKHEDRIPDEALVVRGGVPSATHILRSSGRHHSGVYGFSVQCAADADVKGLATAGDIPHTQVGVTTVGALRREGYDVIRTSGKGHHATVAVPPDLDPEAAERIAKLMLPEPNPLREA